MTNEEWLNASIKYVDRNRPKDRLETERLISIRNQLETLTTMTKRAEEAEAVVEKLPRTKDGVAVTVGSVLYSVEYGRMWYWHVHVHSLVENEFYPDVDREVVYRTAFVMDTREHHYPAQNTPIQMLYSSREAALSASEKGEGDE